MVDADERIALANVQAADLLGVSTDLLKPGTTLRICGRRCKLRWRPDRCWRARRRSSGGRRGHADGRPLAAHQPERNARRRLHRRVHRHHLVEKAGGRTFGRPTSRLDAALDNMSQGLCLYDAQQRLEVVNRRFFEIFGLPRDQVQPGITFRKSHGIECCRRQSQRQDGGRTAGGAWRVHQPASLWYPLLSNSATGA